MAKAPRIGELKQLVSLVDLVGTYVDLKKEGGEYKGLCPFHGEKTPSFGVYVDSNGAERYHCHGCGKGGDHLDFLGEYHGLDPTEALERLREIARVGPPAGEIKPAPRAEAKKPKYTFVDPPPDQPAPARMFSPKAGTALPVVSSWAYRDEYGKLLGYVVRLETPDGKKEVIPLRWAEGKGWRQQAFSVPRPIYGAELLTVRPHANVIIPEGEKACDAARRLFQRANAVAVTWSGGTNAIRYTDWGPMAGRKVLLWPDADAKCYPDNHEKAGELMPYFEQPGMAAMMELAGILQSNGCDVRIVGVPQPGKWPDGEDIADLEAKGWTESDLLQFIIENAEYPDSLQGSIARELQGLPRREPKADQVVDQGERVTQEPAAREAPQEARHEPQPFNPVDYDEPPPFDLYATDPRDELPFRVLGYDSAAFYYYPTDTNQVIAFGASRHTPLNLLALAPRDWWASRFPGRGPSTPVDWLAAASFLMECAKRRGFYKPTAVRGRGAWWDDDKAVINIGDALIINGERYELAEYQSRYVYTRREPWRVHLEDPLPAAEAIKLLRLLERLSWERSINAKLAAGWAFLAPIGGALDYRPSIWLTGASGVGKSTVQDKIIGRVIEDVRLYCSSNTSEPGLRQSLEGDSIPVQFDEFEAEDQDQQRNVSEIERLVTMSATDNGAGILKGGADGRAVRFIARSMFCFSSVDVMIKQFAAASRISVLSLVKPSTSSGEYDKLVQAIDSTLTPDFVGRLHARAITMIPIIRTNARTFAVVVGERFGSRRMGDQYGTLLAGAFALHSSKVITAEDARAWLEGQDWKEEAQTYDDGDERRLLTHLFGQRLRTTTQSGSFNDFTVGELVMHVDGRGDLGSEVFKSEADKVLRRHGLRVDHGALMVANAHPELSRRLERTRWAHSWGNTLARVPGATRGDAPANFQGVKSRYVSFPLESVQ